MSLLKTNEIQNYNGSSLTLTASTVSTSAQLNTGGNISVTGSLNVSDDSTTRTNLGLGTISTQDSDSITVTGGTATLGALTVSGSDSGDLVRITQTGSGNALVVEDSTNPDSTPFVVNASGSVGIGTDSPSTIFHVRGTDTNPVALRMENTTTTTGKTWQMGSTNAGLLQLATIPGVADYVTVNSSGNVGVGTDSISGLLHLSADTDDTTLPSIVLQDTGTTSTRLGVLTNRSGDINLSATSSLTDIRATVSVRDDRTIRFNTGGTERMSIDSSGALILTGSTAQKATGTTWSNPSDQRLKSNISDYPKGTAELMQVRVREWEYNGKGGTVAGTKGLGVIADEIASVLPDTVDVYEGKLNADDEEATEIKKFDATEITWLLVKTVQEQQTLIESQQSQINALTARIEALETT